MNFVVGGIKGLASTISFKKKEPNQELKQLFRVPENDLCVHDFNCALQDKILLQGNLYIYNTMICFHSHFNKNSIVGREGTIITIPYGQIVLVEKKKKLVFDNSIKFTTVDGCHFFTSFLSRDKAHKIICEYLELYQRMLPKPSQIISNHEVYLNQKELNQINNEDEWLKQAILSIQNMENASQNENAQNHQEQIQQNNIINQKTIMNQSRLRASQQNQMPQQQHVSVQQNRMDEEVENKNIYLQQQLYQGLKEDIRSNPQQYNQPQQYNFLEKSEVEEQKENRNNNIEDNGKSQNNLNQIEIENEIQPLELQKSVIKEYEDHAVIYKPLFDERSNAIKQKIAKEFTSATFSEITIKNISAREFFGIFFSNQMYKSERLNKKFNSFFEYYILEYLHGTKLSISEIQVPPPEIYNSIYSNNYLQLLEYPEFSERQMSFTHPIPNASAFLPKSLQCTIKENIYWQSPQAFTFVRYLALKGAPMTGNIEPRVVYFVEEIDGNTTLKSGFYVHFKSSSMFKKIIEKASKEENEKTWNELKNIIQNVSSEYIQKRDENKLIVQQENQQFLKEFNPNEYEQYDEDDLNENIQQKNKVNEQQVPKLQPQQQQQYEQELSRVAAQASNQACTIF